MTLYLTKKYSALAYTSRPYPAALAMIPPVSYILYAASSHERTDVIITLAQFEEKNLVEDECTTEEDESISSSIDELYTSDGSYDGSIIKNALEDIQDVRQVYPDINARDTRLKMRDRIKKTQSGRKGTEISVSIMGKCLYKVFKDVLNESNISLPTLI